MGARVTVDRGGITAALNGPPGRVALLKLALRVETQAKRNCSNSIVNVDTGRLRAGNLSGVEVRNGRLSGYVRNEVEYAVPVHEGRRGFTAAEYGKKALKLRNGRFVSKVGPARPRPFLARAVDVLR